MTSSETGQTSPGDAGCMASVGSNLAPGVTTLAGNGRNADTDGTGGPNGTAEFSQPFSLAFGADCNVYVADVFGIRKVESDGEVTTIVGGGEGPISGNGIYPAGSNQPVNPFGLARDVAGNLYVSDEGGNRICRVDLHGNVTTLAGRGGAAFADGPGGPEGTAEFDGPRGLAVDASGNIFVADTGNNRIRKIDPAGNVTTVAGNGQPSSGVGTGGPDGTAEFNHPNGLVLDSRGDVFVADADNYRICKIGPSGNVTIVAGSGSNGFLDGFGIAAEFSLPGGIAIDPGGNLYVSDDGNNRIRKIDPSGDVTTVAGNGMQGFADGTLGVTGSAEFNEPNGVAVDSAGNIYVADIFNFRIRKVVP